MIDKFLMPNIDPHISNGDKLLSAQTCQTTSEGPGTTALLASDNNPYRTIDQAGLIKQY